MSEDLPTFAPDDPDSVEYYSAAFKALKRAKVDFLVGGAYSFARYSGVYRHTKDLDLFLRPRDVDAAQSALGDAGFDIRPAFEHWIAKAYRDDHFIDLIYGSGNGMAIVDDGWFDHAVTGEVAGETVDFCPAEESIWSKAFIMERHRFDGADVAHVFRRIGSQLDWQRLLDRFDDHWPLLFSHVVMFSYVYPGHLNQIPGWVRRTFAERFEAAAATPLPDAKLCRGTLLSALEYLPDIERWGYHDARLPPVGNMTPENIRAWTEGVRAG
ncbi:MAG: hypothetical protein H0T47_19965 [Planctomycetaceae bacterium]|nr:hypothetical protein [Planctomycetaceae bacterium]